MKQGVPEKMGTVSGSKIPAVEIEAKRVDS